MQTGVKDGRVTLIMSYIEWLEMSDIINYFITRDHSTLMNRGPQRDQICKQILEDTKKLDIVFSEMAKKELDKIPEYLKLLIRETSDITPPIKEPLVS